jgi:hypothetical protein
VKVFCGIDWAEKHHEVALVNRRIDDDAAGFRSLLEMRIEHGDSAADPIPVAIVSRATLPTRSDLVGAASAGLALRKSGQRTIGAPEAPYDKSSSSDGDIRSVEMSSARVGIVGRPTAGWASPIMNCAATTPNTAITAGNSID